MQIAMFYPSLVSDWGQSDTHFLRGVVTELLVRGHDVRVYEPEANIAVRHIVQEHGEGALESFRSAYPCIRSIPYTRGFPALERELADVELVLVHPQTSAELVRRIGAVRASNANLRLLLHDADGRAVWAPSQVASFEPSHFDGVLACAEIVRQAHVDRGWAGGVWTWHHAADTRIFHPCESAHQQGELVWVGNWGGTGKMRALRTYLLEPATSLGVPGSLHGVRFPRRALREVASAGLIHAGWLPNFMVPAMFSHHRVTIHAPCPKTAELLPGLPSMRIFEALACGIPLISGPWDDADGLFESGADFLVARDGAEMTRRLREVLHEPELREALGEHGWYTILTRHACAHRVDRLMAILQSMGLDTSVKAGDVHPQTNVSSCSRKWGASSTTGSRSSLSG